MGGPVQTTYSFKDLVGVLDNDVLDAPIQMVGGNIGLGTLTIRMLTDRMEMETGADGVVMPSYIPGLSAELTIEIQQTSSLHHALLDLFNALSAAADGGDLSNIFGSTMSFRTVLDGSKHNMNGVGFKKVADKPYASKGQNVSWTLLACECVNQ